MLKKIVEPYLEILFPPACICCGDRLKQPGRHICDWCKTTRFESAFTEKPEILPDFVVYRYTMWMFDKGGYLQDLMYNLKYNFLETVGDELGQLLGVQFTKHLSAAHPHFCIESEKVVVVPVPLHKAKQRKRGYNQARAIAAGFARVTGWPLIEPGVVIRSKRTKTQTGLSTEKRSANLKEAFQVTDTGKLTGRTPIIIDDVFTTGATTFELAQTLNNYSENPLIATVARA
jgi:ComF family protein